MTLIKRDFAKAQITPFIRHNLAQEQITPDEGTPVLILLKTDEEYIWRIGHYNNFYGWILYRDVPNAYKIIEWYDLPHLVETKEEETEENKQMRLWDYFGVENEND